MGTLRAFIEEHYGHFSARELRAAARAYEAHIAAGGKIFLALAGALSTARIGSILARALRAGLVHGISCTGANLEEDAFRLVGAGDYETIEDWASYRPADDAELYRRGMSRVTDTAIPESAMRAIEEPLMLRWQAAAASGRSATPAEFLFDVLADSSVRAQFRDPESSWLLAAREVGAPVYTPGWEDSSTGNAFTAAVMRGDVASYACVVSGAEQMARLARWYVEHCEPPPGLGFLQVGGGIAGDFAICAVPLIRRELYLEDIPPWGYFAQISDAEPTYGGYSGAMTSEKLSWGKIAEAAPRFSIRADATLALPLLLGYVLGD